MGRIGLIIVKAGIVRRFGLVSITVIGFGVFITWVSVRVCWRFCGTTVTSFGFSSINCNEIENMMINFTLHLNYVNETI